MKKTMLTLALVGVFTLLLSKNSGVGSALGQDRTGSPVGFATQCGACHNGGTVTPTIATRMIDTAGNVVFTYDPGATYTYEVELIGTGTIQYGFQTVGLISSNNANAGNLTALSPNAKVITLNGRRYGEHITKTPNGLFQMQWTAPLTSVGTVKFYAAGVAVNANNSSSGDKSVTAPALVLGENSFAGDPELNQMEVQVFPNPCTDVVHVQPSFSGDAQVVVYDMTGKSVYTSNYTAMVNQPLEIETDHFTNGTYVLTVHQLQTRAYSSTVIIKK